MWDNVMTCAHSQIRHYLTHDLDQSYAGLGEKSNPGVEIWRTNLRHTTEQKPVHVPLK